jgi:hypothetical protein
MDEAEAFLCHAARPHAAAAFEDFLAPTDCAALSREIYALSRMSGGGCTFFIASDEEPCCQMERCALAIAEYHMRACEDAAVLESGESHRTFGAEWWQHVIAPDEPLSIHWDSDETGKSDTGRHIPPYLATVTYLTSLGAPTVALPVVADIHGRAQAATSSTIASPSVSSSMSAYLSFPLRGKHFSFDGRLLHGVPYDGPEGNEEQQNEEVSEEGGARHRVTFLVNLWIGKRPTRIERLPAEILSQLTDGDGSGGDALFSPTAASALARGMEESLGAGRRFGEAARSVAPVGVPPTDGPGKWREFRIGSFRHPPVHLRPLGDLWSRPDSGGTQATSQAHFLEFSGVELSCT